MLLQEMSADVVCDSTGKKQTAFQSHTSLAAGPGKAVGDLNMFPTSHQHCVPYGRRNSLKEGSMTTAKSLAAKILEM